MGRIVARMPSLGQPGKHHPDCSHVLLDRRSGAGMLFDVRCDMDRFDIFKIGESGPLSPVHELADRLGVRHPGVLVADWDRENSKNRLVASGPTSAMMRCL
jgi:hypothetical protein